MMKNVITFMLLAYSLLSAQTSSINGTVIDSVNNNVLIGANVVIQGTSLGVATDNQGKYSISNINPGHIHYQG